MATPPIDPSLFGYRPPVTGALPYSTAPTVYSDPRMYMQPSSAQSGAQIEQAGAAAKTAGRLAGLGSLASPALGVGLAGVGIAGGVAQSMANNGVQRTNRARIDELERLKATGGMGLTPVQQRQLQQSLTSPMQRAASSARLRGEQLMAASGGAGAAGDIAAMRDQQARQVGEAGQQAALQTRAADEQRKAAQLAELEGRTQAQAQMKADDYASIFGTLKEGASAGGALLAAAETPGAKPGTWLSLGGNNPAVTPVGALPPEDLDMLAKLTPEQRAQLLNQVRAAQAAQGR